MEGKSGGEKASLLYHAGALGDFITALPAMVVWRRLHSGERIVHLGRPAHASLAADPKPFEETWDAGSAFFSPLFSPDFTEDAAMRERFSGFGTALVFATAVSPLTDNLSRLGIREITRQDPFPQTPMPIVDYHLALFPQDVLREEDRFPRVCTTGAPPVGPPHPVLLHPGSGSREKNWPLARYAELAQQLEGRGERVLWIVGPAEADLNPPRGAVVRSAPLAALAASLRRARLYVGNDSGITHLAAASGCPTIALFGASDSTVWAPRGRTVRVLEKTKGGVDMISVHDVFVECERLLDEAEVR
jgi:heptosyltransferase-3